MTQENIQAEPRKINTTGPRPQSLGPEKAGRGTQDDVNPCQTTSYGASRLRPTSEVGTQSNPQSQPSLTATDNATADQPPDRPEFVDENVEHRTYRQRYTSQRKPGETRGRQIGSQLDILAFGASVRMISLEALGRLFGGAYHPDVEGSVEALCGFLDALQLPRVTYPAGPKKYVNLYGLESCLFPLGLPRQWTARQDSGRGMLDMPTLRVHQELAGVMYTATTREAVKARVKHLARELLRFPDKDLTSTRKSVKMYEDRETRKVYVPIPKGGEK